MKKNILLAVFTLVVSVGFVFGQKKSMAVMPFDVVGNAVTADEIEAITELYTSALIETGRVSVVDRTNFDKIMKELNFQSSDWSNSEKTAKLGKVLNAKFISRGKIMKLGSKLTISASIIDIQTAENIASTKASYQNIDELVEYFFKKSDEYSYYRSGKIDDMVKIVADFYSGKGQAGGSIFYNDGSNSYEAIFLDSEGRVSFKKALELASGYYEGYNDWRLPKKDEVKYILNNIKGTKDKSFWLDGKYIGESYLITKTGQTTGVKWKEPVFYNYPCVINGNISKDSSSCLVCLVRKFTNE